MTLSDLNAHLLAGHRVVVRRHIPGDPHASHRITGRRSGWIAHGWYNTDTVGDRGWVPARWPTPPDMVRTWLERGTAYVCPPIHHASERIP